MCYMKTITYTHTHILPVPSMLTQSTQPDNSVWRGSHKINTRNCIIEHVIIMTRVRTVNWRQIHISRDVHPVCSVVIQGRWDWKGDMLGTKYLSRFSLYELNISQQITSARLSCIWKLRLILHENKRNTHLYFKKELNCIVWRQRSRLEFGRYSARISAGTPTILNSYFAPCVSPSRKILGLGGDCLLPYLFQFISLPTISSLQPTYRQCRNKEMKMEMKGEWMKR
jgi:hypothetical protein